MYTWMSNMLLEDKFSQMRDQILFFKSSPYWDGWQIFPDISFYLLIRVAHIKRGGKYFNTRVTYLGDISIPQDMHWKVFCLGLCSWKGSDIFLLDRRISLNECSVTNVGETHGLINNKFRLSIRNIRGLVNPCPVEPGCTLPLQTVKIQISWLLKKPTDLDLHCLPFSMWIYINNLDQVWLKIWKGRVILIYSAGQGLIKEDCLMIILG